MLLYFGWGGTVKSKVKALIQLKLKLFFDKVFVIV